ncbi:hypothetical protein [Streptomyces sp. CA-111067]|uniref:hypothetical protein n=1 Tax=Streptomyces sp. CA-111067 TaxID=3240046 RepID=UPI003D96E836
MPGKNDFSGIDPLALHTMMASFSTDKETLHGAYNSYFYRFSEYGLDTQPLSGLSSVALWMDDQLPGLKRRYSLAMGLERGGDFKHVVQVPEPVISTTEARKEAKQLATQMSSITRLDGDAGDQFHTIALDLAAHKDDPEFCAAFYGSLDPRTRAQDLPSLLPATGSKTAADDLVIYSKALGSATRDPYPDPGFDQVKKLYTTPVPKTEYQAGWNRAAMMHFGDFDTKFLASATRASVLDQVAKDKDQDFSGSLTDSIALGLPQDTVALALSDLDHDGTAAYTAFSQMGDPKHPDLQTNLDTLFQYAKADPDAQDGLTRAVNAGAGVKGHTDSAGDWHVDPESHDDYQNAFAMAAMIAAGRNRNEINASYDGTSKMDLGRLAASYPNELFSGGNGLNSNIKQSTLGVPTDYTDIPGVTPSFVLSPEDTYSFLETFAGDDSSTAPYDEVMGSLQHTVLIKCAQVDNAAVRAGKQDPQHYEDAAQGFGTVQRMQYEAEIKVRGDKDAMDEATRENQKRLLILGGELAGEPELNFALRQGWRAGMFTVKEFGGSAYVDSGVERTEGVEDKNYEMLMQTRYTMTSTLLDGGWKVTTPLPDDLRGPDGKLKPYEELAKDKKLDDFDDWVNEQRGGPEALQHKQSIAGSLLNNNAADLIAHEVDEG